MSHIAVKISHEQKELVNIAFDIQNSLALIGESGSGKSLTIKALLKMLPSSMEAELEEDFSFALLCGKTVGFVPQNPFTALSGLTKIKKQFFSKRERVLELFEEVGLESTL